MPPVPVPLLGIPQKPRNISKNRGYPAIVHIYPQMSGCYPHQCGQLCGKLGITPGERADNPESMPRRGKRSLSQKSQTDSGFLVAPKRSENPRSGVETPKVENPVFWGSNAPKPAVSAEKAGAWEAQRVRSFGEPGTARESGFAKATRQVTLRSLTTPF